MAVIGYKPSGDARGWGRSDPDIMRVTHQGNLIAAGWIKEFGIRAGKETATNATIEGVVFLGNASYQPTTRVTSGASKTLSTRMNDRTGGQNVSWTPSKAFLASGAKVFVGLRADTAGVVYGMKGDGAIMFRDLGATSVPSTFDIDEQSAQGHLDAWVITQDNRPPNPPTITTPQNGSVTTDTSPTITIRFSDPDESYGDYFAHYLIEVWDAANTTKLRTTLKVATGNTLATGSPTTTASYTPTALDPGVYVIRAYTYDHAGARSKVRQHTITISPGGSLSDVDINGEVGTINFGRTDISNIANPSLSATWTHSSGLAMEAYEIKVIRIARDEIASADPSQSATDQTAALLIETIAKALAGEYRSTVEVARSVTSGSTFTIAYADLGYADLQAGDYGYFFSIRGRDTADQWGGWTDSNPFIVNVPPTAGTFSPSSGSTVGNTDLPMLRTTIADASDDDGTHTVYIDVGTDPGFAAGTWVGLLARYMGNGVYEIAPQQITGNGVWYWRVHVSDPWGLGGFSGGTQTLNVVDPPQFSNLSPSDDSTIVTGTPTISATIDRPITSYQITIREQNTDVLYYQSPVVSTSGSTISHAVPEARLRNEKNYQLVIRVTGSDGITGTSTTEFRLEYVPDPAMANVIIQTVPSSDFDLPGNDLPGQEPNVEITWTPVSTATVPDDLWLGYVIERSDGLVWRIVDRNQIGLVDMTPASGKDYTYSVQYERVINDIDTIRSAAVEEIVPIRLNYATLTSLDGLTSAVSIHFWDRRVLPLVTEVEAVEFLGQRAPDGYQSPLAYQRFEIDAKALDHDLGAFTAQDVVEAARNIAVPLIETPTEIEYAINALIRVLAQVLGQDPVRPVATGYYPRAMWYRDPKGSAFPVIIDSFTETHIHEQNRASFRITGFEIATGGM